MFVPGGRVDIYDFGDYSNNIINKTAQNFHAEFGEQLVRTFSIFGLMHMFMS